MKKRISKFSVHQSSKVIAIMHGIMAAIVLAILLLAHLSLGMVKATMILPVVLLGALGILVYAGVSYILFAIWILFYNLAARWVGGIEVSVDE